MWGDATGAVALNHVRRNSEDQTPSSSKCSASLVHISGPAHIPLSDTRWQELFLSYEVLVHLDRGQVHMNTNTNTANSRGSTNGNMNNRESMISRVCQNMEKNTRLSSNMAGFSWHLTTMMNELIRSCDNLMAMTTTTTTTTMNHHSNNSNASSPTRSAGGDSSQGSGSRSGSTKVRGNTNTNVQPGPGVGGIAGSGASMKIALVGKARVVCGALNLYRILIHEIISKACLEGTDIEEVFLFQRRQGAGGAANANFDNGDGPAAAQGNMAPSLICCLMSFLSLTTDSKEMAHLIYSTAELYDATVFCLNLVMVLFSVQLYQPMLSSFQAMEENGNDHGHRHDHGHDGSSSRKRNFFLDLVMQEAWRRRQEPPRQKRKQKNRHRFTSKNIMTTCLDWMIKRPAPPQRSIALHLQTMAQLIANEVKGEKKGPDGMYENHAIVMANSPSHVKKSSEMDGGGGGANDNGNGNGSGVSTAERDNGKLTAYNAPRLILDATNKVIHVSSSLLLLPIRLMVLALKALGHSKNLIGGTKGDDSKLAELGALYGNRAGSSTTFASPTNDVLWISDSPIADLGSSLFLLLSNNNRGGNPTFNNDSADADGCDHGIKHAFRLDLESLDDNRWDGYSNDSIESFLGGEADVFETINLSGSNELSMRGSLTMSPPKHIRDPKENNHLTTNFEHLFESFRGTLHNEVGSLVLYTLIQASPIFAKSLAVRSDLDKLVLPLLRTLYYSSSITHHISGRTTTTSKHGGLSTTVNVLEQPYRSPSQLYVILILLLILSQDASFGPDSFRRSNIPDIPWYRERQLKDISIGSLLVTSLLRSVTYNLNRMQDPFLLSNCCAVLLNLSPNILNLHPYAAMRLVSVLISTMKRYTVLVMKNGGRPAQEGDVSSLIGMYAEACRILLQVVKHAVRRKVVDHNLHLVYALIYHQRDLYTILKAKSSPFKPMDTEKIRAVMKEANKMIQEASARNAQQSMEVLQKNIHVLKGIKVGATQRGSIGSACSVDSTMSDSTMNGMEDFKFTYEEEADPETFFVPYVWDVIVSTVTSNSLEWDRMNIKVFAIMHHANDGNPSHAEIENGDGLPSGEYAKDAGDVV